MGIKNYQSNLIDEYPNIIVKKPIDIYYLCIDLNMILHKICHQTNDIAIFSALLEKELYKLIKKNNPKFIAIFTDGQAILAKAHTQIKRRNKYLYHLSSGICPLNLTPGTPFMNKVDELIIKFLNSLKIKSFYSPSTENNEGEIKLFNWLVDNKFNEKICIIGNDSDLIVLALSSKPLLDLYIYNGKSYISLFKLIHNLSSLVCKKYSYQNHPIRNDFVLLSLLQGNDYNNKIADFKKLVLSYKKMQVDNNEFLITKNGQLNLNMIKKLLSNIQTNDEKIYNFPDILQYFKCIQWNLDLYNNKTINNFIPKSINVNIKSIIKHFPKYLKLDNSQNNNWLHPDVYLLLLMPSTGKCYLPDRLKQFMDNDSCIKDLFPDPCKKCIEWKNKIKLLDKPPSDPKKLIEYKKILSDTNISYTNHLNEFHNDKSLPIKRITDAVLKKNTII